MNHPRTNNVRYLPSLTRVRPATCPTWCNRDHAPLLSTDPTDRADVGILACHQTDIAHAPGLRVCYATYEFADPSDADPDEDKPCLVTVEEGGGMTALVIRAMTPGELRAWAVELCAAADRADMMAGVA